MDEQLKKQLKKRLGEGMIVPAASGTLLALCDLEEYKQSKAIGGFVYQMPICLHVKGGGAGQYEETINRYLSLEEARLLREMLDIQIAMIEECNPSNDEQSK